MKHTPGPWVIGTNDATDNEVIIRCDDVDGLAIATAVIDPIALDIAETDANARLISSAPDLLNALQMFLDEYANGSTGCDQDREARPEVKAARAAIAKATGNE